MRRVSTASPEHAAGGAGQLRSRIYREVTKELWIGTFHALFARMLRYEIDKFKDAEGLTLTGKFSIYDEADAQPGQGDRHPELQPIPSGLTKKPVGRLAMPRTRLC